MMRPGVHSAGSRGDDIETIARRELADAIDRFEAALFDAADSAGLCRDRYAELLLGDDDAGGELDTGDDVYQQGRQRCAAGSPDVADAGRGRRSQVLQRPGGGGT